MNTADWEIFTVKIICVLNFRIKIFCRLIAPQCTTYAYFVLACLIPITPAYQRKYFNGKNVPIYGIDIMFPIHGKIPAEFQNSFCTDFISHSLSAKKNKKNTSMFLITYITYTV